MKNSIIAVGLGLLVLASCARVAEEDKASLYDGKAIAFSAVAGTDNLPETKVSYSGEDANSKERINWTAGDRISIYCPLSSAVKSASYSVDNISAENETSKAAAVAAVEAASILKWGLATDYTFYARYPDPTWTYGAPAESAFRSQSRESDAFTCVIPAEQTLTRSGTSYTWVPSMKYCYLTGYGTATKGSPVTLNFTPAVTTFEVSIGNDYISGNDAFTVKTVEIISSSKRLSGTYTATIGSTPSFDVPASESEADRKFTFTPNGNTGITVPKDKVLKFTFFACPVEIEGTAADHLSVKLTLANGDIRTKELKNGSSWLSYTGGHKYRIDLGNVPDPYSYNIDTDVTDLVIDCQGNLTYGYINVTSTKNKLGTVSASPWRLQYYDDATASWINFTSSYLYYNEATSSWSNSYSTDQVYLYPTSSSGSTSAQSIEIRMNGGTANVVEDIYDTFHFRRALNLRSALANSESNPLDLSLYDLVMDPDCETALPRETANCYIVRAKGWYCFPLVYGNAIKDGTTNTSAYISAVSKNLGYPGTPAQGERYFQGGLGDITQPYITGATATGIVWNTAGSSIDNISLYDTNADGVNDMLKFQVTDNITPGSVVIKVTDGTNTIWSWHIWIVPNETDLTEKAVYNHSNGDALDFYMLTADLGQTPPSSLTVTAYPERVLKIRFVSTRDGSAEPVTSSVITITRPFCEKSRIIGGPIVAPHYQWGRKDPIPSVSPSAPSTDLLSADNKKNITNLTYNGDNIFQKIAWWPEYFLFDGESSAKWYRLDYQYPSTPVNTYYGNYYAYPNLWDMQQTSGTNYTATANVHIANPVKSVYDPSPRGYCVARKDDFLTLTNNTTTTNQISNVFSRGYATDGSYSVYLKTNFNLTETIAFPYFKQRYVSYTTVSFNSRSGRWTSAPRWDSNSTTSKSAFYLDFYKSNADVTIYTSANGQSIGNLVRSIRVP